MLPVLRDGAVVATPDTSNGKESTAARVGDRSWTFAKQRGALTGRRAGEPEDAVRPRAGRTSWWTCTWALDHQVALLGVELVVSRRNTAAATAAIAGGAVAGSS